MQILSEACVLLIVFILYWYCRERRKYLKRRIGAHALLNIYQVGRNVSFMLMKKDLQIKDDTKILQRGGILFSFHFGVWESMPQSLKKMGYNLGVIVNRYSSGKNNFITKFFDRFLYKLRSRGGVKIFYKEDTMKIIRFIKSGGVIGMLVDGNSFYSKFGKARKLSCICNVPLVPFAAYRKSGVGVLRIGCDLNKLIAKKPYDYVWFYKSRNTLLT